MDADGREGLRALWRIGLGRRRRTHAARRRRRRRRGGGGGGGGGRCSRILVQPTLLQRGERRRRRTGGGWWRLLLPFVARLVPLDVPALYVQIVDGPRLRETVLLLGLADTLQILGRLEQSVRVRVSELGRYER